MIIISRELMLSQVPSNPLGTPIFGLDNVIVVGNVAASDSDDNYPVRNLANPNTALYWQPTTGNEFELLVSVTSDDPIDYVAIAGHNFGAIGAVIKIEVLDADYSPPEFVEITSRQLPSDAPTIFRFTPRVYAELKVTITTNDERLPRLALLYVGKLLVAERGATGPVTPMNFARQKKTLTGRSESGNFLGRITIAETLSGSFGFEKLRSSWYREKFDPFIQAAGELPFFFAWRPEKFPDDIALCWLLNDPQPSWDMDTGTVDVQMQLGGLSI